MRIIHKYNKPQVVKKVEQPKKEYIKPETKVEKKPKVEKAEEKE